MLPSLRMWNMCVLWYLKTDFCSVCCCSSGMRGSFLQICLEMSWKFPATTVAASPSTLTSTKSFTGTGVGLSNFQLNLGQLPASTRHTMQYCISLSLPASLASLSWFLISIFRRYAQTLQTDRLAHHLKKFAIGPVLKIFFATGA